MASIRTLPHENKSQNPEMRREIENFDRNKLQPVTIHYVNRPLPGMYNLPMHGYMVIESKPRSLHVPFDAPPIKKTTFANTIYFGPSLMHAAFIVSPRLLELVLTSKAFSDKTKEILKKMKSQEFPAVEIFFRELLKQKHSDDESKETKEKLFYLAQDPFDFKLPGEDRKELFYLLQLNRDINGEGGAVFPYDPNISFCEADREAFESHVAITSKSYPRISIQVVHDLFQQQLLYQRYLEQKAGIGTSFDDEKDVCSAKEKIKKTYTQNILSKLVKFSDIPYFGHSNCNKSTATFLQEAENLSAREMNRSPDTIQSSTWVSFGSGLRMPFWQPVAKKPLDIEQLIQRLISDSNLKNIDENEIKALSGYKGLILQKIDELDFDQQEEMLRRCLDEKTVLGKIFHTMRLWRETDKSRGYLSQAHSRLEALTCLKRLSLDLDEQEERSWEAIDLTDSLFSPTS